MRVIAILFIAALAGCSNAPERRSNQSAGFLEPTARNTLAVNQPDALVRTAEGFERGGDLRNARRLYDQVVAVHPGHVGAIRGQARVLIAAGTPAQGITLLEEVYSTHPNNPQLRRDLLNAYIQVGDLQKARDILAAHDQAGTIALHEMVQLGALEEVLGNASRARDLWDRVQTLAPNSIEARVFLALSFALDSEFETGISLLQPALQRTETKRDATLMLANIYALSGQWETAVDITKTVLSGEEARNRRTLYQLLPSLRRAEQARALLLGQITQSALDALRPEPD